MHPHKEYAFLKPRIDEATDGQLGELAALILTANNSREISYETVRGLSDCLHEKHFHSLTERLQMNSPDYN